MLALLGLAVVAVVAIVLLSAVGPCSEEDLQLAQQIPPYGGAQLEYLNDPEGPGCVTVLEVEASATEVLDHDEAALEEDGWDVSVQDGRWRVPKG